MKKPPTRLLSALALSLMMTGTANATAEGQITDAIAPELATGSVMRKSVKGTQWMVASANPHASKAAESILKKGGNAIDAMVAVQTVLGLVEPQSSGIGGGAFLVYWDNKAQALTTFDGRETAPMAATPTLFLDDNGQPLKFYDAVVGGLSVGTPGTLRLMHDTHAKYGDLSWRAVLTPAIELAQAGFEVSPRLAALIEGDADRLRRYPATHQYFFDDNGNPLSIGDRLVNLEYASTLKMVAEDVDNFYQGPIADDIVATVQNAAGNPGVLSKKDLADYRIVERQPVCAPYRQYRVCGMGPPTSGAITVGQILGILSNFPLKDLGKDSPESWRLMGDASRLAFADRGRYIADTDYVPVPTEGLLAPEYLKARAALIPAEGAMTDVSPGMPQFSHAMKAPALADDQSIELPSTSHFSIVDKAGNIVSITTTIENGFGSRLMTRGFLLNNELTDFSFATQKDGVPIANRIEPGKRPRSSMAPTIVMRDGKPYMAVGSPGGSRIIGYVAKTLVAHLDWGLDIQSAIDLPHLVNRFGTFDLEAGTDAESFKPALEEMGYNVNIRDLTSGIHGIVIDSGALEGGADPRREGLVTAQ
ncbi:gamma-glutamyltransferase [Enterovibrio norvegicus FF-162]|uniref:Glutathione hydrolase proenzyme n=1 Tax=Enterovibrio norvegicus FF-454 TaxID=1185651 RepID=A0A1E5CDD9_9GAMM|nr:gamma-glutamyltransferase [Enterovibrio norvegicus]OEE63526.1 gamma-glutamyltransferase [Enterovibrio norvegicus FF-454]OEE82501.1 gamma-glutamyltransferase [Enterovibrio norvegicus FF-162]